MPTNLGLLKEQAFGLCKQCKSNHKCTHTDGRNVYCTHCSNIIMEIPHDTPPDQEKINKAVEARDGGYPVEPPNVDDISETVDVTVHEAKAVDVINFKIRKLNTGMALHYQGQEHYFVSKTALIKHLQKEVF